MTSLVRVFHRPGLPGWLAVAALLAGTASPAQPPVALPPPRTTGGPPLLDVLRERQSRREFAPAALPDQMLSDLLWAAWGINRPETAHRTAPSAMNSQEIDLYVLRADGAYLYDAGAHRLLPVAAGDLRARTGGQDFVKVAPLALVLVADHARMTKARPEVKETYAWHDAGYVCQNIYLYCASAGLATVVHELGDRAALGTALGLRPEQRIIVAQSVGLPGPPRPSGQGGGKR